MQRRFGILTAASIAFLSANSGAQDSITSQQVAQGDMPNWVVPSDPMNVPPNASGLAFVRIQELLVHLDARGKSTYVGQRIVLLQPQALQLGNISFAWNPASGTPTVHAVRIHRGTETIDVLESASFDVLRNEGQLELAVLSGTLTAVLKVPDLRVGDELDFAYTLPTADPTLQDQTADVLALNGTPLPGRYRLRVSWDAGSEPQVRSTNDFSAPVTRSMNAVEVQVDNPPALSPPKDAPPRYAWRRLIEFSDFATWEDLSQRFASLFTEASKLPRDSTVRREAERIASAQADPLSRAQAALALVQQQVRYVYVGLNGGNFRPASAEDTWQRRYGDCKAKTALLIALLDELGIAAQPVLVRNLGSDDGFDARLPNPSLFDHVVVRAIIGGTEYWLDGSLPVVATPSVRPDFPYHWVLPLADDGRQGLERVEWSPATVPDSINLYEIDARAGFTEPARKTTVAIKRGPAALGQYLQVSAMTGDQLLELFRNELSGGSEWNAIDSVSYRFDPTARAGVLRIVGTGPVDWDDDGDGARSLSLPGGGFSPPDRRQRAASQDQDAPFYAEPEFNCHVTTVRLPGETSPENWSFNTNFDTVIFGRRYYRAFERRDSSVHMVRGSRIEQPEIDKQQAMRDNGRLAQFDNSKAWIHYTPDEQHALTPALPGVPATYENDWLQQADACLPSGVKR